MNQQQIQKRIQSIDVLRGIVMVIMALDHVRDFFHIHANTDDPLNLSTTTPVLFFTRFITHFCAPVFVFLSGTSIYLQSLRKSKKELSSFLIKRGLWLIFAEWFIISLAWTFNPTYPIIPFQVIWAIGISMIILGLLIWLPYRFILTIGIIIVLGHNLLDIPESAPGFKSNFLLDLLHHGVFTPYQFAPGHYAFIVYPFLAWTGIMMLGYCTGIFFAPGYAAEKRKKVLLQSGIGLLLFFIALRFINSYGDPLPWSKQTTGLYSFLSFINVNKYPPSLQYFCITIGCALLALTWLENIQNRFTNTMQVFGRTAFFYYILHLYLIHLVAMAFFFANGHTMQEAKDAVQTVPFLFVLPGKGLGLVGVYLVWLCVVAALYPLCKWYNQYKSHHKEKWWLSYV